MKRITFFAALTSLLALFSCSNPEMGQWKMDKAEVLRKMRIDSSAFTMQVQDSALLADADTVQWNDSVFFKHKFFFSQRH